MAESADADADALKYGKMEEICWNVTGASGSRFDELAFFPICFKYPKHMELSSSCDAYSLIEPDVVDICG